MQESWKEDPAERPTADKVLARLTPKLPRDQRSLESGEFLSPAHFRFRATTGDHFDITSVGFQGILHGVGSGLLVLS